MQAIVMLLLFLATTVEYFISEGWLPGFAKYSVEIMSAGLLVFVIAAGVLNRFKYVRSAYWLVFGSIVLTMACSAFANHEPAGPLFAGLRNYLQSIPMFFVPAVYAFSDRQVQSQLKFLLAIAIVQFPLAVHQRMATLARAGITGDQTYGTFMISSFLSIFLIACIAMLVGLYLRKVISLRTTIILFLIMVIPTTINETKGTLLFFPLAMITVFLVGAKPGTRLKNVVMALFFLISFGAIFIPIYDRLIQVRAYPTTIAEFFTKPGRMEAYLSKRNAQIGTTEEVGRMDSLTVTMAEVAKDPVTLVFGLGPGNASKSSLGPQFTGEHYYLLGPFLFTAFAVIISELGLFGLGLVIGLFALIFGDCRAMAKSDNPLRGAIALGWSGVTVIMLVGITYKNTIPAAGLSYLFWYFSGLIAADRMRLLLGRPKAAGRPS
jgi:hypothetical protein